MTDLTLFGSSQFDAIRRTDEAGEFWTGRDLAPVMDYLKWENFAAVISKARYSLSLVEGADSADHHFLAAGSDGGRWGNQRLDDYRLTRFAAYLTAMAGDDTKKAVAEARVYFAVKTREAETAPRVDVTAIGRRELAEMVIAEADRADREALRADTAEAEVIELRPRAVSWDVLADTGADYSVREAAYILNRDPSISTGQRRLFELLRSWRLIGPGDKPYSNHSAHVTLRPRTRVDSYTKEEVPAKPQVRVTVAGLSYLHKRMGGTAPLVLDEDGVA
jgi:DNA-damage-inducible protein D